MVTIKALVFDVGGVLEKVGDLQHLQDRWCERLDLAPTDFAARLATVDPDGLIVTGGMDEPTFRRRYAEVLGLDQTQTDAFMQDMWDWYCGEPDQELIDFVAGLRPAYRTGLLSNSADGARREEDIRYHFADLVDELVYSHEVGLAKPDPRAYLTACARLGVQPDQAVFLDDGEDCVQGALSVGMQAIRHRDTASSVAAITELLGGNGGG